MRHVCKLLRPFSTVWKTGEVIHSLNNIGDNYSPVIHPLWKRSAEGVERTRYFQRVVIRKPTKAMPKPIRMFHELMPGIGSVAPLR